MKILSVLVALLCLVAATPVSAQQQLLSDPEIYEKDHFRKQCAKAEFGSDFITRMDINNDGLIDAVANHGAYSCDGVKGPACSAEEGCPYNFYLQVKEGGYFMIATARIFSYDFIKRFGNMVFVFKMAPKYCDRTDGEVCEMTVRVRGAKFVTISKK